MKKLILAAFALTAAASVFAQGTVVFNNRIGSSTVNQTGHIWGPGTGAASTISVIGLGSNDSPVGTAEFPAGSTLIGAGGATGIGGYRTTFSQLLYGLGGNVPEASLVPAAGVTTFRTGTSLGDVASITSTLGAGSSDAAVATMQIVAWDNSSGLYPTWTQASAAWLHEGGSLIAAGKSGAFNVANIGGSANLAPVLTSALTAGQSIPGFSFNLYYFAPVPEPSTFALAGLGLAALVAFRRRS